MEAPARPADNPAWAPLIRAHLGRQLSEFKANHAGAQGIDTADKNPEGPVSVTQGEIAEVKQLAGYRQFERALT